jgi:hypothetical protein
MTEPRDPEDALRRALAEVAASTPNADVPPRLDAGVAVLADRRRREHRVLSAVAAVVVVVAAITGALVLAGDDEEPESLETADDTTTTVDRPTSTSTSFPPSTSTSTATTAATATTQVPTGAPRTAVLASGAGWEALRTEDEDGSCVVIEVDGVEATRACGLDTPPLLVGPAVSAFAGASVPLVMGQSGELTGADGWARRGGGFGRAYLEPVDDPLGTGLRFLVGDVGGDLDGEGLSIDLVLTQGEETVGAIIGLPLGIPVHEDDIQLNDGEAFGPWPGYRYAAESLSMGILQEIGVWFPEDQTCLLARVLNDDDPRVLVNRCIDGSPTEPLVEVRNTTDPTLVDVFGLAPETGATEWFCEMPSGRSCGSGMVSSLPGTGAAVLSWPGPIGIEDNGARATTVTFELEGSRFEVAIPPA